MNRVDTGRTPEGFENADPVFNKTLVTVMLLAIAVGLVLIILPFGIAPIYKHFALWHESKSYTPVEAKVIDVKFFSKHDTRIRGGRAIISELGRDHNRTTTTFAYIYQGENYFSHRTTLLNEDYERRDGYPKELFDQLNAKFEAGESVTIWVNPLHPEQAIYDRSILLLSIITYYSGLFLASPIVAIGLIAYIVSLWRAPRLLSDIPYPTTDTAFARTTRWLAVPAEHRKLSLIIFSFLIFNSIAWPLVTCSWRDYVPSVPTFSMVFMCAIVSILLLHGIAKAWKAKQRLGDLYLLVSPYQELHTKSLHGQIKFIPPLASKLKSSATSIEVKVRLEYKAWFIERKSQSRKDFPTLWQSRELNLLTPRGALCLNFNFNFPEKITLSPYDEVNYFDYFWKIRVEISGSVAEFKLPKLASIPIIEPTVPQFAKQF